MTKWERKVTSNRRTPDEVINKGGGRTQKTFIVCALKKRTAVRTASHPIVRTLGVTDNSQWKKTIGEGKLKVLGEERKRRRGSPSRKG